MRAGAGGTDTTASLRPAISSPLVSDQPACVRWTNRTHGPVHHMNSRRGSRQHGCLKQARQRPMEQ